MTTSVTTSQKIWFGNQSKQSCGIPTALPSCTQLVAELAPFSVDSVAIAISSNPENQLGAKSMAPSS